MAVAESVLGSSSVTVAGISLGIDQLGSGSPVVLVHGWMCDRTDMAALGAALAIDHQVVSVDLRGHGASSMPDSGFGLTDFADDIAGVIAALGLSRPVVAGHSMGGAVALVLAQRFPDLTSGIVMIDSPWAFWPPSPQSVAEAPGLWGEAFATRRDRLASARLALHGDTVFGTAPQAVAAESFASLMAWDGPGALRAVDGPVHAIFSDANWQPERLSASLGVHAIRIPQTGHWIQLERPADVADVVRSVPGSVPATALRPPL
jgi:pimeloyl-ACP methyl ester carboxylesterase